MAQFDIFIDTTVQEVVRGFGDPTTALLPTFVQGDTPTLRIWPLVRTTTFNGGVPYAYLSVAGLSFQVAIGTRVGNSSLYYTQQFIWTADANNQSISATLPLNTSGIDTLLGTNSQASAWFEAKYLSGGLPTTILDKQINVQASVIKAGALIVPPGATALTAEDANAAFLKRKISGSIFLEDINNPGSFIAVYNENGSLKADPVSGTLL
jgi:hypothetical protein